MFIKLPSFFAGFAGIFIVLLCLPATATAMAPRVSPSLLVPVGALEKYSSDRDFLGRHLVIDLTGCNPEKIKEVLYVEMVMVAAVLAAGATIVAQKFHQFSPQGVSGAVILAESHAAIHTWPEHGRCLIDIFTCGSKTNNFAALEVMVAGFEATGCSYVEIGRGCLMGDKKIRPESKL
jgi:S-adenosylmethionine decarboxylase